MKRCTLVLVVVVVAAFLASSCGDESQEGPLGAGDPGPVIDTIPPAAIDGLFFKSAYQKSVALVWQAPGDDGDVGTAQEYDIRYLAEPLGEGNWESAIQFDGETPPKEAGQPESTVIPDLQSVTQYHFGIKTRDEEGNESELSNVVFGTTLAENQPPAAITDLEVVAVSEAAYDLTWTAPGDDNFVGRASRYAVRYHTVPITDSNWRDASRVADVIEPSEPGTLEQFRVEGVPGMLNHYFAVKTADEVPNWSALSNVVFAIGGMVKLYLSTRDVYAGEQLTIHYRAPGDARISVHLNRWAILAECVPAGANPSDFTIADIIYNAQRQAGAYTVTFDFTDLNGAYLPTAEYFIVLCWDGWMESVLSVDFYDE